ncbi:hypothetical protein ACUY1T_02690 [Billgrantia sp. Q4P2]|uniref:hypothetical protein n=1 Tax=Billgrantia sp. Q4P2 TaxID=3463857 RepID=UPI0040579A0C
MGLDSLYRDMIHIEKPDGQTLGPIKASVQKGKIHLQALHPLEPGDVLVREMPFGDPERYVVNEPNYYQAFHGIPAHYQAEVTREAKLHRANGQPAMPVPSSITYNFYGAHARFNQNSTDHSVNITIEAADGVFDDLRAELTSKLDDAELLSELSTLVDEMQKARSDGPTMAQKLGQFVATGANVMGIIGPFIPVLTAMASGVSS